MTSLDAQVIRQSLGAAAADRLAGFDVLAEIDSTNSYLMRSPGPAPGDACVAVTDNQTNGRGRHGRTWISPPGSGLCLSVAYSFAQQPSNLPALTLAVGIGIISALEDLGVHGVQLKWPNDLVADDRKLGGILTETQSQARGAIKVVTGLGLNLNLPDEVHIGKETDSALRAVDLSRITDCPPRSDALVGALIDAMWSTFISYEATGFDGFVDKWSARDWLFGRAVTVDLPAQRVAGVGAGIAADGALLLDTGAGKCTRITSGSVLMAGTQGTIE